MFRPPSKASTRLPLHGTTPAAIDLQNLIQYAQSYPGEQVELSWSTSDCAYTLTARLPIVNPKNTSKRFSSADTEWTLLTRQALSPIQEQAWKHTCADIEFISNLLAVLPGATPAGQTTEFTNPGAAEKSRGRPLYEQPTLEMQVQSAPQQSSLKTDASGATVMSGDISEIELNGILQSIALLRMTGCLELHAQLDQVFLYFEDGILVHALYESTLGASDGPRLTGEKVLLEILLWSEGKFSFHPGKKVPEKTVNRRLDGLLAEAAAVQDYWKQLKQNGVSQDTLLARARPNLSRDEFDKIVAKGLPIDLGLQQRVYLEINGRRAVQDIISKFGLTKLAWIPLIFNLHHLNLISFASGPQNNSAGKSPLSVPDNLTLNKAKSGLTRIESGMMSYELFFHFLQMEFERARKQNSYIFSVIVFSIHSVRLNEPLSVLAVSKLTEFIDKAKDQLDLLAHFRENDYVILCPCRDVQQSAALAERVVAELKQCTIDGLQEQDLKLAFGVAALGSGCSQVVQLLSAAEEAKDRAMKEGRLVSWKGA